MNEGQGIYPVPDIPKSVLKLIVYICGLFVAGFLFIGLLILIAGVLLR